MHLENRIDIIHGAVVLAASDRASAISGAIMNLSCGSVMDMD